MRIKESLSIETQGLTNFRVELEGIEPSSKQGNHTLSTRLFRDYSRFNRTALSEYFGTTASERCLVLSPCD